MDAGRVTSQVKDMFSIAGCRGDDDSFRVFVAGGSRSVDIGSYLSSFPRATPYGRRQSLCLNGSGRIAALGRSAALLYP